MREFLVVGHEAPTDADFSLADLPGAGRLDLLARCVTAACLTSHGIREAVRVRLVLADSYTVRFETAQLRGLHPDERSTAARVRAALAEREAAIGHQPVEVAPGVSLVRRGFEPELRAAAEGGTLLHLARDGEPAAEAAVPDDPAFALSDHRPFTDDERALLAEVADRRLSLGPVTLHADHAIPVAHNWLDTGGYRDY